MRVDDKAAFSALYERYCGLVYNYLSGFLKDPVATEDLAHEVFIKLWEVRNRLDVQTSFEAYLLRTCRNSAITALKKTRVDSRLAQAAIKYLESLPASALQPTTTLEKYDRLLDEAVASLSPQRRKIFLLCREEGKTYEQVAREMGLSINTVKEHMKDALKALRTFLGERGELAFFFFLLHYFQ